MTLTIADARSRIRGALAQLVAGGDTAGGVADALAKRGITGVRGDCRACPIAVYLRQELPADIRSISVSSREASAIVITATGDRALHIGLPVSVQYFIDAFDRLVDAYSDLALS